MPDNLLRTRKEENECYLQSIAHFLVVERAAELQ